MPVPIADQIAAVEAARRASRDHDHLDALVAAKATLEIVAANADGLRELIRFLRARPRWDQSEADALRRHPAVVAVLAAFPEAEIERISPVTISAPENTVDHDEE